MAKYSIIVAYDEDYAIGRNGDLIYHIKDDMKHFKEITSGHTVVMGRTTWESLKVKPLPNRNNIVISRDWKYKADGAFVCHNIEEVKDRLFYNDEEVIIIGGAQIYEGFINSVDTLYVTKIYSHCPDDADRFFPMYEMKWDPVEESEIYHDDKLNVDYQFITYKRSLLE